MEGEKFRQNSGNKQHLCPHLSRFRLEVKSSGQCRLQPRILCRWDVPFSICHHLLCRYLPPPHSFCTSASSTSSFSPAPRRPPSLFTLTFITSPFPSSCKHATRQSLFIAPRTLLSHTNVTTVCHLSWKLHEFCNRQRHPQVISNTGHPGTHLTEVLPTTAGPPTH